MKKRLLSVLLIVCLCAALLPTAALAAEDTWSEYLWICGKQVTSENAHDVLSDGGKVSYDRDEHTLTLNNATLSTMGIYAILISDQYNQDNSFPCRLTINLIGKNTITVQNCLVAMGSYYGCKGLTLSGSGSLTIECTESDSKRQVRGISLSSSFQSPQDGQPLLIIDGVTLEVRTKSIEKNYAIYLGGSWDEKNSLSIQNGAQVTVTAGDVDENGKESRECYGIYANSIRVDGANTKLTATAGKAGESYGVWSRKGITVNNASLLAQAVQEAGESVGALNTAPVLTFTNGYYDWRTAESAEFTRSTTTEYKYDAGQTYVEVKPTEPEEKPDEQPDENPDGVGGLVAILDDVPFVDVGFNDYFYDSVKWAYHNGVTGGTDAWHFSPDAGCTRAQAVTFLWRAAGCPTAAYLGNFTDVDADAYYAPAVAWAVANGVTNGTSATTFSPEAACSRGEIVTFLFRAFGGTSNGYTPFTDVPANAYYADAVAWAYEHNVTGGTSSTTFSPADPCSRAQIVTFLYRVLG